MKWYHITLYWVFKLVTMFVIANIINLTFFHHLPSEAFNDNYYFIFFIEITIYLWFLQISNKPFI